MDAHPLTSSATQTTREGQQGTALTTADVSLRTVAAVAGLGLLVMAVLAGTMFAVFICSCSVTWCSSRATFPELSVSW